MTLVQLIPGQTGIRSYSGVNSPCLNISFLRNSSSSLKLLNRSTRRSSQLSQLCVSSVCSVEVSHEFQESQSHKSRNSAEFGLVSGGSASSYGQLGHSAFCNQRMDFTSHGQAEVLALGLVAVSLLLPEQTWAVDMEAAATQGLMGWAANEPANALSLPTWVIHVASVAEWVTAMALVWKYGDTRGKSAWKGLTWGMVPLLGGAMCACTWHFFYNDPSLEVLVVLQAFLTVAGNCTMWAAAYRIWKASQEKSPAK